VGCTPRGEVGQETCNSHARSRSCGRTAILAVRGPNGSRKASGTRALPASRVAGAGAAGGSGWLRARERHRARGRRRFRLVARSRVAGAGAAGGSGSLRAREWLGQGAAGGSGWLRAREWLGQGTAGGSGSLRAREWVGRGRHEVQAHCARRSALASGIGRAEALRVPSGRQPHYARISAPQDTCLGNRNCPQTHTKQRPQLSSGRSIRLERPQAPAGSR
jgi:hypothetical protein